MIIKPIPLFPTPGAPRITSLTSDKDDFFLRTCLIPRIPLLEFILELFTLSYKMLPQYLADFLLRYRLLCQLSLISLISSLINY